MKMTTLGRGAVDTANLGARPPSPDPTGGTRVPARDRGIPGQTYVWATQYLNAHPNPSYGDLTRFPGT